jgi:hypothetical protein
VLSRACGARKSHQRDRRVLNFAFVSADFKEQPKRSPTGTRAMFGAEKCEPRAQSARAARPVYPDILRTRVAREELLSRGSSTSIVRLICDARRTPSDQC